MIQDAGATTAEAAVDHLSARFLRTPLAAPARAALVQMLTEELGTTDLGQAETYMEYGLRLVAHGIMCAPQYQLA